MKVWAVLVGVKLQPDQHPKTPVIHKEAVTVPAPTSAEGRTRSPIPGTEDTPDQRASLRSFAGSGRNRKYCIAIFGSEVFGGGFNPLPPVDGIFIALRRF
jgi:hypothetical protein